MACYVIVHDAPLTPVAEKIVHQQTVYPRKEMYSVHAHEDSCLWEAITKLIPKRRDVFSDQFFYMYYGSLDRAHSINLGIEDHRI